MKYIDLHRHIEGSLTPRVMKALGWQPQQWWKPGADFFSIWPDIIGRLDSTEIVNEIAYQVLVELSQKDCVYVELQVSPAESILSSFDLISAIKAGMLRAERDNGMLSNLIFNLTRHMPEKIASEVSEAIELHDAGLIVGIGLAGDEVNFPISALKQQLRALVGTDVPLSFHAGEFADANEIWSALEFNVSRIGHGIRAVDDSSLMVELRSREVGLEICLTSELLLQNADSIDSHPIHRIVSEGLRYCLNTDDPAVFETEIDSEYEMARAIVDLQSVNENAAEMAFCSDEQRKLIKSCLSIGQP